MERHFYKTLWTALAVGTVVECAKLYIDWPRLEAVAGVLIVGVAVWVARNYMRAA